MFRLRIDRGQGAVLAHTVQQPQSADPGTGSHLDHCTRAEQLGVHTEQGAHRRRDRRHTQFGGPLPRGDQDLVLDHGFLHVGEVALQGRCRWDVAHEYEANGAAVSERADGRCFSQVSLSLPIPPAHRQPPE